MIWNRDSDGASTPFVDDSKKDCNEDKIIVLEPRCATSGVVKEGGDGVVGTKKEDLFRGVGL